METITAAAAFLSIKLPTILIAGGMAILGVFIDGKRHHWPTAVVAIIAGMAMAALLVDPLQDFFHLTDIWKNALAGLLGIGGRNLVVVISKVSRNPSYLIRLWRGQDTDSDGKAE